MPDFSKLGLEYYDQAVETLAQDLKLDETNDQRLGIIFNQWLKAEVEATLEAVIWDEVTRAEVAKKLQTRYIPADVARQKRMQEIMQGATVG